MAEIRPIRFQTLSGKLCFIRTAYAKDAEKVLACARSVIGESVWSLTEIDEFLYTVEDEIAMVEDFRKDPSKLFLVVECEGAIVGNLDFKPGPRRKMHHTGEFGMGLISEFRDQGLGSKLLEVFLDWAKTAPELEKVCLAVHASNERAIAVYKKRGFEIEGVKKREIRHIDGRYDDTVMMAKFVR